MAEGKRRRKPFIDDCPDPEVKEVYALLDKDENVVGLVRDELLAKEIVANKDEVCRLPCSIRFTSPVERYFRVEFADLDCVMKQFWGVVEEPPVYRSDRPGGEE